MTASLNGLSAGTDTPAIVLAAHNGALGDFLCCWPGLLAIARQFSERGPDSPQLYFAGRAAMHPWVLPLGYVPCPPGLGAAMDSLYVVEELPTFLAASKIFWFCLDKPPALPCLERNAPKEIVALPILSPPALTDRKNHSEPRHVLSTLKAHLEHFGLTWPTDWRETWGNLFGTWQGQNSREIALLPGSGHKNKEWPLRYFKYLAEKLGEQGWEPVFIIGEAELERGLLPPEGIRWEAPSPPPALAQRLRQVRAVVSNDSGPAHLAGTYNVPGVVLFGPTSPETWGVPGMINITTETGYFLDKTIGFPEVFSHRANLNLNFNFKSLPSCSPCTSTLRGINCSAPVCLESLPPETVLTALHAILRQTS